MYCAVCPKIYNLIAFLIQVPRFSSSIGENSHSCSCFCDKLHTLLSPRYLIPHRLFHFRTYQHVPTINRYQCTGYITMIYCVTGHLVTFTRIS